MKGGVCFAVRAGLRTGLMMLVFGASGACGSAQQPGGPVSARIVAGGSSDPNKWPADDRSLCEGFVHWKNNPALEASETVGANSIRPNIRRIYKTLGGQDDRHTVLVCREIDTNLDGVKDVVRTFNEKGEPRHEEADTNYDGKIDDWVNFGEGRIIEEDIDSTYSSGRPNIWKFFVDGQLSRIRRNTHCPSGNADVWEIYFNNRLERVGTDATCDGHVDRWDRDAQLMASEESGQEAAADGGTPITVNPSGEIVDGGPPPQAKRGSKRAR
ncbi:MAG: hypothetical protein ACREJ3_00630 [Polyangiaceae bacterium]